MSVILLPDKWRRQPSGPVAINEALWPGRAQAFLPSLGYNGVISAGAGSGRIVTLQNANAPFTLRKNGKVVHAYRPNSSTDPGESFKWQTPDFDVGPNASMVFYGYTLLDNYGVALEYGGSNWGLLLNIDTGSDVRGSYVDSPTTAQFDATISGAAPAVGVPITVGLIKSGNAVTVVTSSQQATTTGGNGGIRRSAGSGFGIEYTIASPSPYVGLMLGAVSSVPLSIGQMREILNAPYAIFRKQPRILYFNTAGGGATITGDSLTHGHSLSSPSLTQANVLAVQGASQAHSLGVPALTQHNVLAVNALAQAHALGNVTLTQAHILTVQGIAQTHSLGVPSLTQHNTLAPDAITQAQVLGNITLTIAGSIAAADIAQGHSLGTPGLTQHHVLTVAALMQAQSLGQPSLSQAGALAVDGMTQAQVLDALTLVQHHALAVQELLQGHALGNITLTASDALAINGLSHAQILGTPSLTQHNVLAVQGMTHAQILQAVTLGGLVIGSLRGTLVAYSLLDGEVACRALLSGSLETVH